MEYVYAALLLHRLKQDVTEDNVKNVIKATGTSPDEVKVKALVAALSDVNIDEALKTAPVAISAPPSAAPAQATAEESPASPKEEEKKEEEALEGLSSLFG
ncbi:MAG: 50S ribosomal protein P1 [Nitrososphaeraceae archaeon]